MWGRFRHWSTAFRREGANNFSDVQADMSQLLGELPSHDLRLNGEALLSDRMGEWVADLGATQVMTEQTRCILMEEHHFSISA
jgi:hypothetical protein